MNLLRSIIAIFRAQAETTGVAALNAYRDVERGLLK